MSDSQKPVTSDARIKITSVDAIAERETRMTSRKLAAKAAKKADGNADVKIKTE